MYASSNFSHQHELWNAKEDINKDTHEAQGEQVVNDEKCVECNGRKDKELIEFECTISRQGKEECHNDSIKIGVNGKRIFQDLQKEQ